MLENETVLTQTDDNTQVVMEEQKQTPQIEEKVETQPHGDVETELTPDKKYTVEQINEFVRKRLERHTQKFLEGYEITSEDELQELIGKAQSYDAIKLSRNDLANELNEVRQSLWFKENNVNPDRILDIKAHFKGTDTELTNESLVEALSTHPEWLNNTVQEDPVPKTTIQKLTPEKTTPQTPNEEEAMAKMFGLKGFIKK